ncbi:MAG: type II toxin-antitoxin system RelE/ParE family toxin [Parvularculaceae bacterium]
MAYSVVITPEAERDFELIFDFLADSHVGFGDSADSALKRALQRTMSMRRDAASLAKAPHRGTMDPNLGPGRRHVTINRAIFYFETIDAREEVRILAIFFGGQDHRQQMLRRLLG